jgi:hypothetical protein
MKQFTIKSLLILFFLNMICNSSEKRKYEYLINIFYAGFKRSEATLLFWEAYSEIKKNLFNTSHLVIERMRNPSYKRGILPTEVVSCDFNAIILKTIEAYDRYANLVNYSNISEKEKTIFEEAKNNAIKTIMKKIWNLYSLGKNLENVLKNNEINNKKKSILTHLENILDGINIKKQLTEMYVFVDKTIQDCHKNLFILEEQYTTISSEIWKIIEEERMQTFKNYYNKYKELYYELYNEYPKVIIIDNNCIEIKKNEELPFL